MRAGGTVKSSQGSQDRPSLLRLRPGSVTREGELENQVLYCTLAVYAACLPPWPRLHSIMALCVGLLVPAGERLAQDLNPIALMSSLHTCRHLPAHGKNERGKHWTYNIKYMPLSCTDLSANTRTHIHMEMYIFLWLPKVESKKFGGTPSSLLLALLFVQPASVY